MQANWQIRAEAQLELNRRREERLKHIKSQQVKELAERSQSFGIQRAYLLEFVRYTKPDYIINWHHRYLCHKLDQFANGIIKKLMVFMPPQHGKSELVSRRLPAFMLGRNPKLRIVGASYADALSSSFNRDVQRIIDNGLFNDIFPDVYLNRSNVRTSSQGNWLRNSDIFEIVEHGGFYKSVGVGGSLTGTPADITIIDDPIKDAMEAYSITVRSNIWDWYLNVLETRLHNKSQQLLTVTRWHEDDLPGKIIAADKDRLFILAIRAGLIEPTANKDKYQYGHLCKLLPEDTEKWEVISLPAIKEDNSNPDDPRMIGDALWPEMHSLAKLLNTRAKSERVFVSLYQQRPAPDEGTIVKKSWFKYFKKSDLPEGVIKDFYSDTAYGKEKSTNSATMNYTLYEDKLYIWDIWACNLEYPAFKKDYINYVLDHGYTHQSECAFEPKATGITVVQDLKETRIDNVGILNVMEDKSPKDSKETRMMAAAPVVEGGKVFLLQDAPFTDSFLTEISSFPNGKFRDRVDCLSGVILRRMQNNIPGYGETETETDTIQQNLISNQFKITT